MAHVIHMLYFPHLFKTKDSFLKVFVGRKGEEKETVQKFKD